MECPPATVIANPATPRHPPLTQEKFAEIAAKSLASLDIEGQRGAIVVVADKTRLCSYPTLLPPLVTALERAGIPGNTIRFLIAYGTHPRQSDRESRIAYGEVFDNFDFIHHDCDNDSLFACLGTTSRNTPIRVRHDIANAPLLITLGAISKHYFAGYGGGRKLLFPGLGARPDIERNHSLYLDFDNRRLNPSCAPGVLDGNPVAEDLKEISSKVKADIAFHGIPDHLGEIVEVIPGHSRADFLRACDTFNASNQIDIAGKTFDVVVASAGGYPKDLNLVQTHKALRNAAGFLNPGGRLILLAECRDGVGADSLEQYISMGWNAAFDTLSKRYVGNGGTALSILSLAREFKIAMATSLDPAFCAAIGVDAISPKDVDSEVRKYLASSNSSALIPRAS